MAAKGRGKDMEAVIRIFGNLDPSLQRSVSQASKTMRGLHSGMMKVAKVSFVAATAGLTALAAAATFSVKNAIAFEKQMSNVATLLDGDVKKRVAELGDSLLNVSDDCGVVSSDLTDGLYQVISAFGDNEETIKRLEIAAKAAKAGNATTTESINMLSAVTKGYGDTSAAAMKKAADLSFQTVKLGQTSFPELAASMGKVIPLAAAMAVKEEELFGAMATLTGVTGNTAEVTTQLRGTIQGFMQPTAEMEKLIRKLGYADGLAMLKARGLGGALKQLSIATRGNKIALASLFGSIEAKNSVLALTGAQAKDFADKTKAMYESTGIAERAFLAQTDNLSDFWNKMMNMGNNFLTRVGQKMLPHLKKFVEGLVPIMKQLLADMDVWINDAAAAIERFIHSATFDEIVISLKSMWDYVRLIWEYLAENSETVAKSLKYVVAGMVAYSVATKAVLIGMKAYRVAVIAMRGVMLLFTAAQLAMNVAFWASPIGLITAGVLALGAAVWAIIEYWPELSAAFTACVDWCTEQWGQFMEFFRVKWDEAKQIGGYVADAWVEFWANAIRGIQTTFSSCMDGIGTGWEATCEFFSAAWENTKRFFEGLPAFFAEIWRKITQSLKEAFEAVIKWIEDLFRKLGEKITAIFDGIANVGKKIGQFGADAWDGATSWIPGFAAGGFTSGPSLCGEAGTEAVISFDPRYRAENRGYLMTAAEMLGMGSDASPSRSSVTNVSLGGVTFAPTIKADSGTNKSDIMRQLRELLPEFVDMIEEAIDNRKNARYV